MTLVLDFHTVSPRAAREVAITAITLFSLPGDRDTMPTSSSCSMPLQLPGLPPLPLHADFARLCLALFRPLHLRSLGLHHDEDQGYGRGGGTPFFHFRV